ncbi:hypothetical protein K1719_021801 [Acacia pycnantha]|nr:hypothetical protein K1719_021801 [Acacia pycnantha]
MSRLVKEGIRVIDCKIILAVQFGVYFFFHHLKSFGDINCENLRLSSLLRLWWVARKGYRGNVVEKDESGMEMMQKNLLRRACASISSAHVSLEGKRSPGSFVLVSHDLDLGMAQQCHWYLEYSAVTFSGCPSQKETLVESYCDQGKAQVGTIWRNTLEVPITSIFGGLLMKYKLVNGQINTTSVP